MVGEVEDLAFGADGGGGEDGACLGQMCRLVGVGFGEVSEQ